MITFGYSPTNCALWLDNELISSGAGLPGLAWWEKQQLGLVVGSDIYATADNVAEAQFEELTLLARWPKKSDWQDLYFLSGKRRALMGPMGSKEEEAEKVRRSNRQAGCQRMTGWPIAAVKAMDR